MFEIDQQTFAALKLLSMVKRQHFDRNNRVCYYVRVPEQPPSRQLSERESHLWLTVIRGVKRATGKTCFQGRVCVGLEEQLPTRGKGHRGGTQRDGSRPRPAEIRVVSTS